MNTQQQITARQAEVLTAMMNGQSASTTQPLRNALRSAGFTCKPAMDRLAGELGYRGAWNLPKQITQKVPMELKEDHGGLTVAGLEALDAYLRGGRRYDPTDSRLGTIKKQLETRQLKEQALADWLAAYRADEAAKYARKSAAKDQSTVKDVRLLLINAGFGPCMHELPEDADVLKLVKAIGNAQHGYGYMRFLSDADLQAELDEAKLQAGTFPSANSVGEIMRRELQEAAEAALARRAAA